MKVYIEGNRSEINLTNRNFITEGGEGKIYGKDGLIYKIYVDPKKTIPQGKFDELQSLNKNNILYPQNILLNSRKSPIGFTMRWAKDTVPICKLFTTDFRKRYSIKPKTILGLVDRMVKDIEFIHNKKCLIVDGSEMNYLVDSKQFTLPYFIDVDSYQTPSFPATAITPTIKDYHTKVFSDLSDWFSFAIISFQLFIGIHPYKGTHPRYKKYELEKRMKDNVSIFNQEVRMPNAIRDFSYIPDNYKKWFKDLFENGKRLIPPSIIGKILVSVKRTIISGSNNFVLSLTREFKEDIVKYYNDVIITNSKAYYLKRELDCTGDTDVVFSRVEKTPILVDIEDETLKFRNQNESFHCNINATEKTIINDMLIVRGEDNLMEIGINEFLVRNLPMPVVETVWKVLPNATKLFDGCVYQNILGIPYFMIPYKVNGKTNCYTTKIFALKGYKILEAKHDGRVLIVIAYSKSKYSKFTFKFSEDYSKYDIRIEDNIVYHIPNFITLSNGIVISITPDGLVEVFSNKKDKDEVKVIDDKTISFDMKLCKKGVDAYVRRGKDLFKFSMKNKK